LSLADGIRRAILESLPREFTGDNDWGQKKEIPSGLKFSREEGHTQVDRRKKQVNHGLWTQYKVNLIDPEQHLQVRVERLRRTSPGCLAFELHLSARIDGEARVERWRRGIKFLNFKAEVTSLVEARVDCEVVLRPAPGGGLGSLVVEPNVSGAHLSLTDVDLHRVSKVDGNAAQELGDRMRRTLDKELQKREGEIVQKLNDAIAKNADKLKFSGDNLLSSSWTAAGEAWSKLSKPTAAPPPTPGQIAAPLVPVANSPSPAPMGTAVAAP